VRRDYELGIILNPEVSEEETQAILGRLEQIVTTYGGQTVRVQQWGRRRLAYLIERHRDGYYIFIDMILTPETVSELERTLKVSETVLRYMFRRRDPKAVQQEREDREARAAAAAANAEAAAANAVATPEADAVATEEGQQTIEVAPDVAATPETTEVPEVPTEDFGEVPPAAEGEVVEA
jgi:small subunit ribosomal protein S6